ncbi:MAG: hypothetical protein PHR60_08005 [Eubacteriales bacterium]|nr:hypothetical protein [Eubacteriales bacterium]
MQPLITIETVPISIEYVEKPSTRSSVKQSADLHISRLNNRMTIQSNPINIQLRDTFETSSSIDWNSLTYTASAYYSKDGNLRMNIQMEDIDATTFLFHQFGRGIDNIMDFLPNRSMHINFDLSQLPGGLPEVNNIDTSFLPPDIEIKVVERPKVIIKYVGGPLYIPRSSDPNYDPPDNTKQSNTIVESKFDLKA